MVTSKSGVPSNGVEGVQFGWWKVTLAETVVIVLALLAFTQEGVVFAVIGWILLALGLGMFMFARRAYFKKAARGRGREGEPR